MKKKIFLCGTIYYPLSLLLYMGFYYSGALLLRLSGEAEDLGTVIVITFLSRFSLLQWYIDPFFAAEIPLWLYFGMIFNQAKHTESLRSAFLLVNAELRDDGGMGTLFLLGLFFLGLIVSFSPARKKGKGLGYRILSSKADID